MDAGHACGWAPRHFTHNLQNPQKVILFKLFLFVSIDFNFGHLNKLWFPKNVNIKIRINKIKA